MNSGIVVRRLDAAAYAGLGEAFAELAGHALEPNPHMAPAAVGAATKLVPPEEIVVLCAWLSEALDFERLVGVWAFRRMSGPRSGFAPVLVSPLVPLYEVSSLPVVDRDRAADACRALMRHVLASGDLPHSLSLPLLPLEGPGFDALSEACADIGGSMAVYESWSRPVMIPRPGDEPESYLRRSLGSRYKKRMQQVRAVGRSGALTFRRSRGAAASEALEAFLVLEAAGWKGKSGTAIACDPDHARYIRRLVQLFAEADGVLVDALLLDGKTLAMGLLLESAGRRHFLKIAYDEAEARHSPGRLLTVAMLRADLGGAPPAFFDSGAGEEVDAGTYVWGERRRMGNVVMQIGKKGFDPVRIAAAARYWMRRLRAVLHRHRQKGAAKPGA
ncbi:MULTISPECIES: GNAT family N-acetyltransferase [unclassified Bosea (in: a-proteobacteria)]|uniref:GNAT family N-acetyltransferase n=1 Tax=unclassified Bosea (in: a-proteobacteria) TaxID=2653178 RepID=UPI000954BA3B|nr:MULTISPECIES: GNAT family N-acetyltransferase [unclassified Bosea (in: a-proteobacteria)]TAJ34629.1 MAG: GNAT family N-acetyltransferase [Bosea sp. (in: a-proteobacteria)]SIQ28157.1 Acetyltransferase (GNAT) domain-containing protein [Bosea sp. TND4EK4]